MAIMPSSAVTKPQKVKIISIKAHTAIVTGLAITTRQLTSTASSALTWRSSNSGIDMTLEANTGAARSPPMVSRFKHEVIRCQQTWRTKSSGKRLLPAKTA